MPSPLNSGRTCRVRSGSGHRCVQGGPGPRSRAPRKQFDADWAVRLYDEYLRRPDLIRLATWARLERRPAGHLVDSRDRLDDHKLRAITEAQAAGLVRRGDPFDVMAMVIAMSMAWSPVSNVYAATAEEPPKYTSRVASSSANASGAPWQLTDREQMASARAAFHGALHRRPHLRPASSCCETRTPAMAGPISKGPGKHTGPLGRTPRPSSAQLSSAERCHRPK